MLSHEIGVLDGVTRHITLHIKTTEPSTSLRREFSRNMSTGIRNME
jgi:hypothetical protein